MKRLNAQTSPVMEISETTQEDRQKYTGKLKGKWVLAAAAPDVAAYWTAPATRETPEALKRTAPVAASGRGTGQ